MRYIAGVSEDPLDERADRLLLLGLALSLLAVGVAAAVWVYDDKTTLAFNDAFGHEKIARFALAVTSKALHSSAPCGCRCSTC